MNIPLWAYPVIIIGCLGTYLTITEAIWRWQNHTRTVKRLKSLGGSK